MHAQRHPSPPINHPWLAALPLLAGAMLSGCFIVGLSDDIEQASCKADTDCAELADLDDDPCQTWQCRPDTDRGGSLFCQYTPLDADNDGYSPATAMDGDGEPVDCTANAEEADCFDDEPLSNPGADEACDTLDNDCDGIADEGVLRVSTSSVVRFSGNVGLADFAVNPETRTVAAVYGLDPPRPGASLAAADTNEAQSTNEVMLDNGGDMLSTAVAGELGVAPLDENNFAVAMFNRSGTGRMIATVLPRGQGVQWSARVDPDQLLWGLGCAADEPCASNGLREGSPIAQPLSARPALASNAAGTLVLVTYQRNPAGLEPTCGTPFEADEQPRVLVNLLTRMRTGDKNLVETTPLALDLGEAGEIARPAVGRVPAVNDAADGFLVAFADAAGDIVLHHVWRGEEGPAGADAPTLRIDGGGELVRPAFAISEPIDGMATLAVAYQRGCGTKAQVEFRLFTLRWEGGALTADDLTSGAPVGETGGRRPSVAFAPEAKKWAVSFRHPEGLQAQVFEADGTPRGRPYLLVEEDVGDDGISVLQDPRMYRLADDSVGFASLAQVKSGSEYSVEMTRILACE